uniref:Uncharacterized protein n=1 Tax=Oncorhynchus tshawytscha TaxID=74940 RepID=A0A8C8CH92_ONCTS
MGDDVSKVLRLVSETEAGMEERYFINTFPDWDHAVGLVLFSGHGAETVDLADRGAVRGSVAGSFGCLYFYLQPFPYRERLSHTDGLMVAPSHF